jgi:hypothetical protein
MTKVWGVSYTAFDKKKDFIPRISKSSAERLAKSMKHPKSLLTATNIKVVQRKR